MRSHTVVHPAITICFVNPFVFKNKIEKEGLPRDGPAGLGAGGPEFKSRGPDQKQLSCFHIVRSTTVHPYFACENSAGRGSDFANPLIRRTSLCGKHTKDTSWQECEKEVIESKRVSSAALGECGENCGDLAHRFLPLTVLQRGKPIPKASRGHVSIYIQLSRSAAYDHGSILFDQRERESSIVLVKNFQ